MKGIYYPIPIDFQELTKKKELPKTTLEKSIDNYIRLVLTSHFGECKFDEGFGCEIWEVDFDLLKDLTLMRDNIKTFVTEAVKLQEPRLKLTNVEVRIGNAQSASYENAVRFKRKVLIRISGHIKETNKPFTFNTQFFIGPFSYI